MSENELSNVSLANLPTSKYETSENMSALSKGSSFLPRIQIFAAMSEAVQTNKIPNGHIGLVRAADVIEDLGDEISCWPLAMRFKAMRFGDQVMAKHNPEDPEFKAIAAEAAVAGAQGVMAGPEFLLYIPAHSAYVTYFMSNTSSKRVAPDLRAMKGKPTTIKSIMTKNKKNQRWHVPVISSCQSPIDEPDMSVAIPIIAAFNDPKDSAAESAPAEAVAAVGGRAR
jgi:hypothetical protein